MTLIIFQGFFITLPYCFINGEVLKVMKTHAERWKSKRALEKSLPMPHSARNSILGGRNSFATAFMTDINDSRSRLITTLLKIDNNLINRLNYSGGLLRNPHSKPRTYP